MDEIESINRGGMTALLLKTINQSEIDKHLLSSYGENHTSNVFHSSTSQPIWFSYNSSLGNIENSNASRHFADYPESSGALEIEAIIIVVVVSLIPVSVIACMIFVISFNCLKRRGSLWSTTSPNEIENGKKTTSRLRKCGMHSVIENENVADHFVTENDAEVPTIDTPLSIYPGDAFPNYLDNSKSSLTTPISNNSIITMTMRNNHLIVETEERIPCSFFNGEQMYACNVENYTNAYAQCDSQEYEQNDSFDETDSYSENHHQQHSNQRNGCTICGQERRPFYEPTTSRQADEEDQHIELFHKNIVVFPTVATPVRGCGESDVQFQHPITSIPSCSYDHYPMEQSSLLSHPLATNTGYSQSDFTGSSSSTSQRAQTDFDFGYGYGNQSEYVSAEFPFKKRSASICTKVPIDENNVLAVTIIPCQSTPVNAHSSSDSVPQLTDCSSPEFSDSSK